MNNVDWFATAICSFLLTYVVHSTIIISGVVLAVCHFKRFHQPSLRVLSWKLAIILPLLTTCWITCFPNSHWGVQIALGEAEAVKVVDHGIIAQEKVEAFSAIPQFVTPVIITREIDSQANPTSLDFNPDVQTSMSAALVFNRKILAFWTACLWISMIGIGLVRLFIQTRRLRSLRKKSASFPDPVAHELLNRLSRKMRVRHQVELLESQEISGVFTAGIWRPYIVVPVQTEEVPENRMNRSEWEALFAHELAHIVHRDASWNLLIQIIKRLLPFQPFNRMVSRQLQISMDFSADELAANVLGKQDGLIQCLIRLGDRMFDHHTLLLTRSGLVAGMVAFRSTLGQRIERLLDDPSSHREVLSTTKLKVLVTLTAFSVTAATFAPQAVAEKKTDEANNQFSSNQFSSNQVSTMKAQFSTLAVLIGLTSPVSAEEPQDSRPVQQTEEVKRTPDELPAGIKQFNGMLVGRLAAKDVEKGSFEVTVDAVPRVWRNSRAENPKAIVGKSIEIEGVFGKFLDVLVTTRLGETLEFECKHDGDALVFPGELLRKVAPYKAEDYPELPEEFRGFRGVVAGEIKKKDPETFELIIEVKKVLDVWKDSGAKQPESIVGKQMMLAGFWNRKEAYHNFKEGDQVEIGMQHIGRQSDHLTVAEFVRGGDQTEMKSESPIVEGQNNPVQGFRGMLVGRLVKKDVERGTFTITVDAVPRVWNNNQSRAPKSLIGQNVDAEGVPPQLLDALVVTRIGETIQFGALYDGGKSLRVGELLRKVAPVEKGDYPELPEDFRGFRGVLQARVVKKDEQLWELTVEVTEIEKTFEKDLSKNAESVVGKQVMLSGFWNKKDAYHSISIGDKIQVGVEHPQRLGDQLSVIEGVRKLDQ